MRPRSYPIPDAWYNGMTLGMVDRALRLADRAGVEPADPNYGQDRVFAAEVVRLLRQKAGQLQEKGAVSSIVEDHERMAAMIEQWLAK